MKIAIFGKNSKYFYSGGRYHALVLAEALQSTGQVKVDYYTNCLPVFYHDFQSYPKHNEINFIINENPFKLQPQDEYDYVFYIPCKNKNIVKYAKFLQFCKKAKARLVLLNFESKNWFLKYNPTSKSFKHWSFWNYLLSFGGLVLSSNKTSEEFAKKFYHNENVQFINSFPGINTRAFSPSPKEKNNPSKNIIAFCRFNDQHKGSLDIFHLLAKEFDGYTFKIILGSSNIEYQTRLDLYERAEKFNIKIKILYRLSDEDKLREINNSDCLVFPSYFEGFGYPPVEARYCKTEVVAYRLPVLEEVNEQEIHYAEIGNKDDLKMELLKSLNSNTKFEKKVQSIESYGDELISLLRDQLSKTPQLHNTLRTNKLSWDIFKGRIINRLLFVKKIFKRIFKH